MSIGHPYNGLAIIILVAYLSSANVQLFRWTLLRLILGLDVKDTGDVQASVKKKGTPMNKIMRSNKAVHDIENQNPNFVTLYHNMKSSTDKKMEIGSSSLRQEIWRKLRRKLLARNLLVGNSVLNRITEFCNDLKRLATRKRVNEIEQMETKFEVLQERDVQKAHG
ncbi:hypothetical protein Tco_0963334 [Tanacetum coccineum]